MEFIFEINKFHPPFFLICIIGQNRQKFKVHKKSRNKCLKAHHYASTVQIWALGFFMNFELLPILTDYAN
jgi:hypothetical protein